MLKMHLDEDDTEIDEFFPTTLTFLQRNPTNSLLFKMFLFKYFKIIYIYIYIYIYFFLKKKYYFLYIKTNKKT
jgi:hypothetical protein